MYSWKSENLINGVEKASITLVMSWEKYAILRNHLESFYADADFEEAVEDFFNEGKNQLCDLRITTPERIELNFNTIPWLEDIDELKDEDYDNPFVTFMLIIQGFADKEDDIFLKVNFNSI
ncbi:MAG: hypothetical protein ACOCWW_01115 [Bacteroidota bacterium]